MRRAILGVLALSFLIGGAVALFYYGYDDSDASMVASIALRSGVLLGAIWLALPQLQLLARRWPVWLIFSALACFGTLVVRPRFLVVIVPLVALLAILQFVRWLFAPLPKSKAAAERSAQPNKPARAPH